jgi:hypothetical protein
MLSVENPWDNPYGILVARGRSIPNSNGTELLDNLVLYFPVTCVRDLHEKKISAELLSAGNGICVTLPSIPSVLLSSNHIEFIHSQISSGFCSASQNAHKAVATEIKDKKFPERRAKQLVFLFPGGMTCNTNYFNYKKSGPKLKNHFAYTKDSVKLDDKNSLEVQEHYIVWKLVVEDQTRALDEDDDDSDEEVRGAFLKRMNDMKLNYDSD